MYINELAWQGYLCEDAKRLEPRHPGDPVLVMFRVAQFMPTRRGSNIEEKVMRLECKVRWDLERADKLCPKLKKGAQVYLKGALEIDHQDTPNGARTYTSMQVHNVQFFPKPMRSDEESTAGTAKVEPEATSAADVHKDAFSPAKF